MSDKKKILALCGSTKAHSTNSVLIDMMQEMVTEQCDFTTYAVERLPFFNPDIDNENVPEEVVSFRAQIHAADAVVICTPEYVFSLPGVLKNALEWCVSSASFSGKPVALIVASRLGEKSFESLQLVMKTIEARFDEKTVLLIQGAKSKVENRDAQMIRELKCVVDALLTAK